MIDIFAIVKPLIYGIFVIGRITFISKRREIIKNIKKIGLNKVNTPNVSKDSYVYIPHNFSLFFIT